MTNWIDHGDYWELVAPQGTDEWKNGRKGKITTSVSAAMVDKSIFKTPEEQGLIIADIVQEKFTADALERMSHGTHLEKPIRDWYEKHIKQKIVEKGLIVPKWDYRLGGSIDGEIVGTDTIIEIKAPKEMYRPLKHYMELKKAGWVPPEDYFDHIYKTHLYQMIHGMAVMKKKFCVYIVGSTLDGLIFTQKIPFLPHLWEPHYKTLIENYNKFVLPFLVKEKLILPPY